MKREEFFDRVSGFDRQQLLKVLWTLYWRGSAAMRQRVETELDAAERGGRRPPQAQPPVDPAAVRDEVEDFVALARAGAYFAGDRRVSPRERTRWRLTFRRLAGNAERGFREPEPADAIAAAEQLIDLACEVGDYNYFRSEDPMEAAKFVVSDAVEVLWTTVRDREGFTEFTRRAADQLIRWESRYGWTRMGFGKTSQKETTLAQVLLKMLSVPDAWISFADAYLEALHRVPKGGRGASRDREGRTANLAEWHLLLLDRLIGSDAEDRLDRLAQHPALNGPELYYLQARLAHRRGQMAEARSLAAQALKSLPGHEDFLSFAIQINAELPARAQQIAHERGIAG